MPNKNQDEIVELFKGMKFTDEAPALARDTRKPITVWVDPDLKDIYDDLQKRSRKEFGKKLKDLVVTTIVKVNDQAS